MKLQNVVVVTKPKLAEATRIANELALWLKNKRIDASTHPSAVDKAALVIVIGGDGTSLAAARSLGDRQVPILAINYGGLGFLTEVTMEEMYPALERVLGGDFVTESRMMMDVAISSD